MGVAALPRQRVCAWYTHVSVVLLLATTTSAPCTAFLLAPATRLVLPGAASHQAMRPARAAGQQQTLFAATVGQGPDSQQDEFSAIEDLIDRGVVSVWRKADAPSEALAGGARGAGHSKGTFRQHQEPEEIFVVGTSHVSEQSAVDVERVIRAVQPDNVVVELCRSRVGIMYREDNAEAEGGGGGGGGAFGISGDAPAQAVARSMLLGGPTSFAIRVALARNDVLSSVLNRTGTDFRAARRTGEDLGATMVLGDRPIEITIERAWRALGWAERRRFLTLLLRSLRADQAQLASQVAAVAAVAQVLTRVNPRITADSSSATSSCSPTSSRRWWPLEPAPIPTSAWILRAPPHDVAPLITERDIFLSLTMKSSMAVNGCRRVVGVIGKGHVKGVMRALSENHSGKFKELTWTPARAAAKEKVFGVVPKLLFDRLVVDSIILIALVKAWEYFHGA